MRRLCTPVQVYYDCHQSVGYATVSILKYPVGGRLEIGNGIYIQEYCNDCGIIVSQGMTYGYATFDYGYILFGGDSPRLNRFGYGIYSDGWLGAETVSVFCTYKHITEEALKEVIARLKGGKLSKINHRSTLDC
jgi:hypothetical protein